MAILEELSRSVVYCWGDYARAFGFKEGRFRFASGIIVTRKSSTCLITTYPGGGQHINYCDQWRNGDLEYRGEGLMGDQKLSRNNKAIAENQYELHVAEH